MFSVDSAHALDVKQCERCECSRKRFVSLLVGTFASVLMSSACDPLAPLQRWITYTQCEVLQIKRELHDYRQEVSASHKIQQQQLDTVQSQLRESEQRITELIEAVAELFQKQNRTQDLLGKLLADLASLRVHSQAPEASSEEIPATQLYHG